MYVSVGRARRPLYGLVADAVAALDSLQRAALRRFCTMMFVSVGAQMPFDRLICAVDQWAGLRRRSDVFAQIGKSNYCARHIETTQFVDAIEFRRLVGDADIVVSHAGMGSIIT